MKAFEFVIVGYGYGDNEDDAWKEFCENGSPLIESIEYSSAKRRPDMDTEEEEEVKNDVQSPVR